jgi:phosphorylcholine metabolism protein LicD
MRLPIEFEEDEIREGFYINGMMKKIWAAQVDALDFLDAYCKKHGLRWFMAYGSLLGIVRHHGFIPWDDDCDIWMLREDFNQLIKLLNNEKDCGYMIRETRIASYTGITPVLANNTQRISFRKEFLQNNRDEPYATTIDIFVLDYVSRNKEDEAWRDTAVKAAVNIILSLEHLDEDVEESAKIEGQEKSDVFSDEREKGKSRKITIKDLEEEKDNTVYRAVLKELENLLILTNHNFSKDEPLMSQVNLVYTGLISYFREDEADLVRIYPNHLYTDVQGWDKHLFDKTVRLPFEGRLYPVPATYDEMLHGIYGDYNKRVIGTAVHDYPFFSKFEEDILKFNKLKFNPYHFRLKKEEMPDASQKLTSHKKAVQEELSIMEQLQNMVDNHLTEMDVSAITEVSQNLQTVAVHIGNQIEESRTANHACIPVIQAYCEQVYQCFDLLSRGELAAENLEKQHDLFLSMRNQIQSDYLDRKEILFLLDREKNWKAVKSLWKVFLRDPSCDVYVMMMPYYYKNADSSLKEEKHIDSISLPEDVQMVTEESYSIALHHPDLIITVNGYDYYNYIRSVSPEFYTRILWKCTDQLVYIPWFEINAFTEKDPQWATVPYFAQIPGVLYADKTVVQSDQVRNLYIKAAEEMDESIPESYWEDKIVAWGSPLEDSENYMNQSENIYRHLMDSQV